MAFATTDDVAARLGRTLTSGEETTVEFLLDAAAAVIAAKLGRTDEWATDYAAMSDPGPPAVLRFVSVEMVTRSMSNPDQLRSLSETLGQASYRVDFHQAPLDVTKTEELLLRRAVYGQTQASPRTESVLDDIFPRAVGTYPYTSD